MHDGSSTEFFVPIFRTHGHRPQNEIWAFDKVRPILVDYDKLRYRLMPYIYSLAWRVTNEDYTIQRPLVMDWRTDPIRATSAMSSCLGLLSWSVRCCRQTLLAERCICQILRAGTTSGRERRKKEAVKLTRMLLSTAFHSMYVPVRSFPSAQKLSTRVRSPQDPSSFGFTREPTLRSICTRMLETATTTKRARILSFHCAGQSPPGL